MISIKKTYDFLVFQEQMLGTRGRWVLLEHCLESSSSSFLNNYYNNHYSISIVIIINILLLLDIFMYRVL